MLDNDCSVPKPHPCLVTGRSFKNFSKVSFQEDLSILPWSIIDVFDGLDDKIDIFNSLLLDILDVHAPLKTVRVKKKPAPWITKHIRDKMDHRKKL